jgi:hypothetical protein
MHFSIYSLIDSDCLICDGTGKDNGETCQCVAFNYKNKKKEFETV